MRKSSKEEFLMRAIESDKEREDQEPIQTESNYGKERFVSFSDLKPKYLEKEDNPIEVNNWIRQLTYYLTVGYRHNPPAKGVYMHLS